MNSPNGVKSGVPVSWDKAHAGQNSRKSSVLPYLSNIADLKVYRFWRLNCMHDIFFCLCRQGLVRGTTRDLRRSREGCRRWWLASVLAWRVSYSLVYSALSSGADVARGSSKTYRRSGWIRANQKPATTREKMTKYSCKKCRTLSRIVGQGQRRIRFLMN